MHAAKAAALLLLAGAAQAQTVNDYQLPPSRPTPTPSPRVQGPVDPESPATAPRPVPAPAPSATVDTAPRIELPPVAAPVARPSATGPRAPTRTSAAPAAVPAATPSAVTSDALETPETLAPTRSAVPVPATEEKAEAGIQPLWLAIGGGILALLAGGLLWMRLRRRKPEQEYAEAEASYRTEPEPSAPAALAPVRAAPAKPAPAPPPPPRPQPQRQPATELRPAPEPAPATGPLQFAMEARHLSRAMVNATLSYRLSLTNRSDQVLGPLRIAGDLTTAHASVPIDQQLSLDGASLAIHEVPALAPGESATLSGELRLPIAEIRPIRGGHGHVFVPLARFHVGGQGGAAGPISITRIFVIGRTSEDSPATLRPFVLEQGPGVQREIGQRELLGTS